MSKSSKRWCFTWNNYEDRDFEYLTGKKIKNSIKYIVVGKEIGEEKKTKHLQGFVITNKKTTVNTVKEILDPILAEHAKMHIEMAYGDNIEASNYCKKGIMKSNDYKKFKWNHKDFGLKSDFYEYGTLPEQGKRNDWIEYREAISQADDILEVVEEYPEMAIKYFNATKTLYNMYKEKKAKESFAKDLSAIKPLEWQNDILNIISKDPDPRKIYWITDPLGNTGKSHLALLLTCKYGGITFSNADTKDIAYAYKGQSIVVFDLARSLEKSVNYEAMEQIKNGYMFSTKYESIEKIYKRPHVFVFSNFAPATGKLSVDRLHYITLSEKDQFGYKPTDQTSDSQDNGKLEA